MTAEAKARVFFEYENRAYTKHFEVRDITQPIMLPWKCVTISVKYANGRSQKLRIARTDFHEFVRQCQIVAAEAAL